MNGNIYYGPEFGYAQFYGPDFGSKQKSKVWNSGLKTLEKCKCNTRQILIKLSQEVVSKIKELSAQHLDTEFLVYLDGKKVKDTFHITKIFIPQQEKNGVHVQVKETKRSMGVLHKHPWPGAAWFSGTDDESINANHDFSIVIDSDNIANSVARIRTPCTEPDFLLVSAKVEGLKNVDSDYGYDAYQQQEDKVREIWEKLSDQSLTAIKKVDKKLVEALDDMFWIQRGKEKLEKFEEENEWGFKKEKKRKFNIFDPLSSYFGRKFF